MLRYCAWCRTYLGSTPAPGYQIRPNVCEIETSTICRRCRDKILSSHFQGQSAHPDR